MKKQYSWLLVLIIGMCSACSLEQEFTIAPKTKKKYISEQQDLEMDGDIIVFGTNATGALADLSKTVFLAIKGALDRVNARIDGEKSGLSKVKRTDLYAIKKKIMHELERSIAEIEKIQQHLEGFMVLLDQEFQSE